MSSRAISTLLLAGYLCAPTGARAADVVKAGAGGYLTTRPPTCKPLPETIYRTADVKGPTPTGSWWSSLVFQRYSQPMFPHPLAVRCTERGLALRYVGATLVANRSGIFGTGIGERGDIEIGHSRVEEFPRADCGGFSDWFVTAVFSEGAASLSTSFGHGSPYVFGSVSGGDVTLRCDGAPQIWSGENDSALGVTVHGRHYGVFGASGSTWTLAGAETLVNAKGRGYFSVAVLPDREPATLELFRSYAHNHVTGTRLEFDIDGHTVQAEYEFTLDVRERGPGGTIFALYPHQWKYTSAELTELSYGSVRGTMKVGVGRGFETEVPLHGVLPLLPAEGIADRERAIGYLEEHAERSPARFRDTYWEGKHLGRLASLSGVAEVAGAIELRETFLAEIKRRLEAWFTAESGETDAVFYFDREWGTLIGSRPSYGSDMPLNDHHFHYGYFVRAAAEVAREDAGWAARWAPMVELLIRDIASPDRKDRMFPHRRCFDAYAGHSWASGDANFGDGNNQESSSEAINAWYGMVLWGELTGNPAVRDLGIGLFNTERIAVEEYWFDVSGSNYPEEFPRVALGMVWGGKGAFATWFSGDIDCIHGINWLPFTPASLYMGRFPEYVKANHDRIIAERRGGRDYGRGWGDLVCMFNALHDPASAAAYMSEHPDCRVESGNTRAFMYHWIHTLERLGRNDSGVTADHPLAAVFQKDGARTYAVYNASASRRTVLFSDGRKVSAAPGALTVVGAR